MSITGETGQAAVVYTYSDFGETEEVVADSIGNEICYTGAVYDKDTGLYYMNARYYDAVTGRFISQDSYRGEIEDAGTWHLYAYCSNNPINRIDIDGHKSKLSIYYHHTDKKAHVMDKYAKDSIYYNSSDVDLKKAGINSQFKIVWNNIDSKYTKVYLFLHGEIGKLCFRNQELPANSIKKLKVKKKITMLVLVICVANAGKNSVAKAFHKIAPNATIYASSVGVSFLYATSKANSGWQPRYEKEVIKKKPWLATVNPVKKVSFN